MTLWQLNRCGSARQPGLRYFADSAERFSGAYAATKLLGERVGRQYAHTHGLEVVAVRLGWVWRGMNTPGHLPAERGEWFRQMWLSDRDFLQLMDCCLAAPLPEPFLIVNGMSANTGMRWDLSTARTVLGYRPRDDVNSTMSTSWIGGSLSSQHANASQRTSVPRLRSWLWR